MEWMQPDAAQIIRKLGDLGFVTDRRVRIGNTSPRLQRVLAALAMDVEKPFRLQVVGLESVVAQRPCRRNPASMHHLAEVSLAQAKKRRTVDLGIAANIIMQGRAECVAGRVGPSLFGLIGGIDKDSLRAPILLTTREVIAALKDQNTFP